MQTIAILGEAGIAFVLCPSVCLSVCLSVLFLQALTSFVTSYESQSRCTGIGQHLLSWFCGHNTSWNGNGLSKNLWPINTILHGLNLGNSEGHLATTLGASRCGKESSFPAGPLRGSWVSLRKTSEILATIIIIMIIHGVLLPLLHTCQGMHYK